MNKIKVTINMNKVIYIQEKTLEKTINLPGFDEEWENFLQKNNLGYNGIYLSRPKIEEMKKIEEEKREILGKYQRKEECTEYQIMYEGGRICIYDSIDYDLIFINENEKFFKELKIKLDYNKIRLLRMIEKTKDVINRMSEK